MKQVVGGETLTYDEYLEIMKASGNKVRHYFELCYYDCVEYEFKGQMKRKSKEISASNEFMSVACMVMAMDFTARY